MTTPNHFQIYRSNAAHFPPLGDAHVKAYRRWLVAEATRNASPFDAKNALASCKAGA